MSNTTNSKPLPSTEYLNECFTYDPPTGNLVWKTRPTSHFKTHGTCTAVNSMMAGMVSGVRHLMKGRPHAVVIGICNQTFYAHRIIYTIMVGPIPDGYLIDHEDVNPWNNRLWNLRLATHKQNIQNQTRHQHRPNDLPKGVSLRCDGKKYVAQITDNHGVNIYIGSFATIGLARAAYLSKALEFRGEFAYMH